MDWLNALLQPDSLKLLIPIVGICGGILFASLKLYFKHLERMEKIRNGIDPDA